MAVQVCAEAPRGLPADRFLISSAQLRATSPWSGDPAVAWVLTVGPKRDGVAVTAAVRTGGRGPELATIDSGQESVK